MPKLLAGSWERSIVMEAHIEYLRQTQKLPSEADLEARAAGGEPAPEPRDGEHVVFGTHFLVGFGLPVSLFLRHFLDYYGLQMHHLGVNSVLFIACFVKLCKAYLGIHPFPSFYHHFFNFRAQMHVPVVYSCGGAMVYKRLDHPLLKIKFKEFFKKWQHTFFFYIRNIGEEGDWVGLPAFSDVPPNMRNWDLDSFTDEILPMVGRMKELVSSMRLVAPDMVAALISRRVQPLQRRPYRMCDMSGCKDPCQVSMVELPWHKVASRVNGITNFQLDEEEWRFGVEPFHRGNVAPPDKVFEKVIKPYLTEVLQHPQSIEMREGMLHIRDVEGPKKTRSVETRLEAMEQQVFKCQVMVERGLNVNHMMITDFTNKHMIDANDIGKHLSRLYDRVDQLQGQIYDL
ncbi:40S ribosomal protein S5-1 [Hordeum vulgare]|nr:40S ribosomal protein S5-1 [Hordeum vulgare]